MKFHFNGSNGMFVDFIFEDKEKEKPIFFEGKLGEVYPIESENKILLGLGKKEELDNSKIMEGIYKLGKCISSKDIDSITIKSDEIDLNDKEIILSIVEGLIHSTYNFDYYKSEKTKVNLENVYFENSSIDKEEIEKSVEELENILAAQGLARDLVNLRANDIYPETLAEKAIEELSGTGVNVKVYNKSEIEEMGLKAFLEVAKGSEKEPKFIIMEYKNGGDKKPLVFVGKGLTYDSGGYSIKPSDGMFSMNSDMGGAGTVIGAMKAIASNNLEENVIGVVAACENMISGKAYKPGDIIDSLSGKKIEIGNTDAEGRVTLADAVYYAADKYDPELIIDLATLTGACLVALGELYTGVITNNDSAFEKLQSAADESHEKIWKLPNDPGFKELYKSELADFKNTGGRFGGTITAGQFIGEFVKDVNWIHMDIAGTAYLSKDNGCYTKGATGVHVKTLYNLAKNYRK